MHGVGEESLQRPALAGGLGLQTAQEGRKLLVLLALGKHLAARAKGHELRSTGGVKGQGKVGRAAAVNAARCAGSLPQGRCAQLAGDSMG